MNGRYHKRQKPKHWKWNVPFQQPIEPKEGKKGIVIENARYNG
jgi:hypothetical protein